MPVTRGQVQKRIQDANNLLNVLTNNDIALTEGFDDFIGAFDRLLASEMQLLEPAKTAADSILGALIQNLSAAHWVDFIRTTIDQGSSRVLSLLTKDGQIIKDDKKFTPLALLLEQHNSLESDLASDNDLAESIDTISAEYLDLPTLKTIISTGVIGRDLFTTEGDDLKDILEITVGLYARENQLDPNQEKAGLIELAEESGYPLVAQYLSAWKASWNVPASGQDDVEDYTPSNEGVPEAPSTPVLSNSGFFAGLTCPGDNITDEHASAFRHTEASAEENPMESLTQSLSTLFNQEDKKRKSAEEKGEASMSSSSKTLKK